MGTTTNKENVQYCNFLPIEGEKNLGTVGAILAAQFLLAVPCFGILSLSCGRNCNQTKTGPTPTPTPTTFPVRDPGVTVINWPSRSGSGSLLTVLSKIQRNSRKQFSNLFVLIIYYRTKYFFNGPKISKWEPDPYRNYWPPGSGSLIQD